MQRKVFQFASSDRLAKNLRRLNDTLDTMAESAHWSPAQIATIRRGFASELRRCGRTEFRANVAGAILTRLLAYLDGHPAPHVAASV